METIFYSIISKCFVSQWVTVVLYYVGSEIEIETSFNEIETSIKNTIKQQLGFDSIKIVEI